MITSYKYRTLGITFMSILISFLCSSQITPENYYCNERSSHCPKYLRPASIPTASFEEKGDLVLGLMQTNNSEIFFSDQFSGKDYMIGCSPLQGFGLILSGNYYKDHFYESIVVGSTKIGGSWPLGGSSIDIYDEIEYQVKGRMTNIAVGYYKAIGNGFMWDTYASIGKGKLKIGPHYRRESFTADLSKISLRSSLNWRYTFMELGMSYGLASQKFKNIEGNVLEKADYLFGSSGQNSYLAARDEHLISEVAASINFHIRNFKLFVLLSRAWDHSHPSFRIHDRAISIGAQYKFSSDLKSENLSFGWN